MPIRKYNPTSPGVRGKTSLTFDDITATEPHAPLTENLHRSGGRNNQGHLTSWWRGGGHKRMYRIIDFKRDKRDIPAKVSTIEYDPNRSARIALLTYADGEKRYILQPVGLKVGDTVVAGQSVDILPGFPIAIKLKDSDGNEGEQVYQIEHGVHRGASEPKFLHVTCGESKGGDTAKLTLTGDVGGTAAKEFNFTLTWKDDGTADVTPA